ncbi:helix-turn-helix domain-containing protein [Desulfobaculum senezii]
MQLPLARCARVEKAERDARIIHMRAEGLSAGEIGRRLGVPASTVRTVVHRHRLAAAA